MPLVRIDVAAALTDRLTELGAAVHSAMVETIAIPADDRFQVLTSRPEGGVVADPDYLGVHRSGDQIVVQITLNTGRTDEVKRALYAAIARNVAALGLPTSDVLVSLVEVNKVDWSFGDGIAQYAPAD